MPVRWLLGYMSQAFSLYSELTVRQNLVLHAQLFQMPEEQIGPRINELAERFSLGEVLGSLPESLPLGIRQRLSLAVATVHRPELLILDEPTSGVDPIARDGFWNLLIELSRRDRVTIFISTHFMNEAERCDRISLMHAGKVLVSDTPGNIVEQRGASSLEQAFIAYLQEAAGKSEEEPAKAPSPAVNLKPSNSAGQPSFSVNRMFSYLWREALELQRDPVRATLALIGSLVLMLVMGFGLSMDVENLSYAVLDHDQTELSRNYALNLSGSRYFKEMLPLADYQDLDQRMRSSKITLAIEIPPGFGRDLQRGAPVQIAAWIDGAMPSRAETILGYVQGMHQTWLQDQALHRLGTAVSDSSFSIQTRFRYNPDVKSLPAMVPAIIPLLLLMLPAMLTALSVVREKELGSIINLYVTPVTRTEFLVGKQLPYVALAMINFLLMTLMAVTLFDVPVKGSFMTLLLAALIYNVIATGIGLLASTLTSSQIAAMFFTMIGTMIPAIQLAGLLNPVSSLEGAARFVGEVYPATHMLNISRGVFGKSLGFDDLHNEFWPLLVAVPLILMLTVALLKKQDR